MKTATLLALALGMFALALRAEEKPTQFDATTRKKSYLDWDDPAWWQREWKPDEKKLTIGKSEFGVKGPLFETFRPRRRTWSDLSLGEKIVNLPIVNLFVPQPMPVGSSVRTERSYFNWGEKDLPWSAVADRGSGGPVGLISVSY